jgi:ankyrin repeat protein
MLESKMIHYEERIESGQPSFADQRKLEQGILELIDVLSGVDLEILEKEDIWTDQLTYPLLQALYYIEKGYEPASIKDVFEKKNDRGETALMQALNARMFDIASRLFYVMSRSGADLDVPGPHGDTALMIALLYDRDELAKDLVHAGADFKRSVNEDGLYPRLLAFSLNKVDLLHEMYRVEFDRWQRESRGKSSKVLAEATT